VGRESLEERTAKSTWGNLSSWERRPLPGSTRARGVFLTKGGAVCQREKLKTRKGKAWNTVGAGLAWVKRKTINCPRKIGWKPICKGGGVLGKEKKKEWGGGGDSHKGSAAPKKKSNVGGKWESPLGRGRDIGFEWGKISEREEGQPAQME